MKKGVAIGKDGGGFVETDAIFIFVAHRLFRVPVEFEGFLFWHVPSIALLSPEVELLDSASSTPKSRAVQSNHSGRYAMIRKILILVVSIIIPVLIAQLPIFPLVVEMREIAQDSESLSQEWRFVSMPEFYDSARFAESGWLASTWNNYLVLAVLNHVGLILVFFIAQTFLNRLFDKKLLGG